MLRRASLLLAVALGVIAGMPMLLAARPHHGRHGLPSVVVTPTPPPPTTACPPSGVDSTLVRYSSPAGGGNGLTVGSPFRNTDFLSQAQPGWTLCMTDGTYQGSAGMIVPPAGRSGTAGSTCGPSGTGSCVITVMAANDGAVFIDGQFALGPLVLNGNNWWSLQGFDVGNSDTGHDVFSVKASNNSTFRRICASNVQVILPTAANTSIFQPIDSANNTYEDICLFGTGRTMFTDFSQNAPSSSNVYRRFWIRSEGYPANYPGNPNTFDGIGQYNYVQFGSGNGSIIENMIWVWDPEQYNLSTWGSYALNTGFALWSQRFQTVPDTPNYQQKGMIFYGYDGFTASGQTAFDTGIFFHWFNARYWSNTIADIFIDGRSQGQSNTIWLECNGGTAAQCANNTADRITTIVGPGLGGHQGTNDVNGLGGAGPNFGSSAGAVSNFNECTSLGTCPNFYTGDTPGTGARNCFQYKNGALTSTPLWPWPMDVRIKAALARAHAAGTGGSPLSGLGGSFYAANTVTSEIASRYGAVPSQCHS